MKQKIIKFSFLFIIIITAFFLIMSACFYTADKTNIVFFGMGKADSIYIENGSENMLIDTGLKSDKKTLSLKLQALKVRKLDYLILTHPDKDHIGAASYILDEFEVGEIIQSNHTKGTKREARIQKVIEEKNIKNARLTEDRLIELGKLKVKIITPEKEKYKKDNNYSLLTLIEDGDLNYLFSGDAEKKLLDEILELDLPTIDLYKVAHHGQKNSNSEKFIQKISPKYAIMTNFKEAGEIDDLLEAEGSNIIYVSEKDLSFYSDGEELKFK